MPRVFQEIQLNGNLLQYMQVVSAIPKDLVNDAWRYYIDKTSILSQSSFQLSVDLSLDLHKMKNRNHYWLLTSKDQHEINTNMKWERDLLPEKIFLLCEELSSPKENCLRMVLQKMRFVLTANKMIQ